MACESGLEAWWVVPAWGTIGIVIDFLLGKSGQQSVKDWLETWWFRLSDVKWGNFGRKEALFALQKMDRWFGRRFFSVRRLLVVVISTFSAVCFMIFSLVFTYTPHPIWNYLDWSVDVLWPLGNRFQRSDFLFFILTLISLAFSFSVTRIASATVARLLRSDSHFNFIGLILLLFFQYVLLCYWSPAMTSIRRDLIDCVVFPLDIWCHPCFSLWIRILFYYHYLLVVEWGSFYNMAAHGEALLTPKSMLGFFKFSSWDFYYPDHFLLRLSAILVLIPTLMRFLLAIVFIGSYCLRPFQRPIMFVSARIIEHEKPVFTLLFAGIAAMFKAIEQIGGAC
jgi:hypothetical protein